jgi:hypothetical protein
MNSLAAASTELGQCSPIGQSGRLPRLAPRPWANKSTDSAPRIARILRDLGLLGPWRSDSVSVFALPDVLARHAITTGPLRVPLDTP